MVFQQKLLVLNFRQLANYMDRGKVVGSPRGQLLYIMLLDTTREPFFVISLYKITIQKVDSLLNLSSNDINLFGNIYGCWSYIF